MRAESLTGAGAAGGGSDDSGEQTASAWISRLAAALGARGMSPSAQAAILHLARDVAHGSERKLAPLASFVAGRHVEARVREGVSEADALNEVSDAAARILESRATP